MWQARAGPGRRHIVAEEMFRAARDIHDEGGVDIAVAHLGTDHLVRLPLLVIGDARKSLACPTTLGRVVANVRLVHRAPFAPPRRGAARVTDVALSDLTPLDLIGPQKVWSAPTTQSGGKLPGKVDGAPDTGIHAETARRNHQMSGVARKEHTAVG